MTESVVTRINACMQGALRGRRNPAGLANYRTSVQRLAFADRTQASSVMSTLACDRMDRRIRQSTSSLSLTGSASPAFGTIRHSSPLL